MSKEPKKFVVWIVLGVVVVAAFGVFGWPLIAPEDPEDAAMKVRRPVPEARRAPGQIGVTGDAGGGTSNTGGEPDAGEDDDDRQDQ